MSAKEREDPVELPTKAGWTDISEPEHRPGRGVCIGVCGTMLAVPTAIELVSPALSSAMLRGHVNEPVCALL